ncbi:type II toxin-antitoxin system antitoxin DNA ADP-ribosyl glycohydrolase DarG [Streptosporangium jomthongense]|uniref:Macro domain-containing protein n=1 Tax=Streptosporangium jomthongense TaxID=1193683 RepID=A0ABV8EYG2_9ACTN
MIKEVRGNILDADVEAAVNTVNTVGVMGKGVALQFKQAFPQNYRAYKSACADGEVRLGRMFVHDNGRLDNPRYIINFPTKDHWRSRSNINDIEHGLNDLVRVIREYEISSIAVPALGCGNGGLAWDSVRPIIIGALSPLEGVEVQLFLPAGAPVPTEMRVATSFPSMTRGRAALLELMNRYMGIVRAENFVAPEGVSLLEIQKLTYLLQAWGENLRLKFEQGRYGPYAENLNHVLQRIEGHYLRGYGDRSEQVLKLHPIQLNPDAAVEAKKWIDENAPGLREGFYEIENLIFGFASPYGLELLATVHWIATESNKNSILMVDDVIIGVQAWNKRKQELFTPAHICRAYDQLVQHGWLKSQK